MNGREKTTNGRVGRYGLGGLDKMEGWGECSPTASVGLYLSIYGQAHFEVKRFTE